MLSLDEIDRFSRQLLLDAWGAAGQERVREATMTVRGDGEAARLCLRYLAAAGVGRLRAEAFVEEVRHHLPSGCASAIEPCPVEGPPRGLRVILGEATNGPAIDTDETEAERAAVGCAVAVEALKAALGLPFRARVVLRPE